MQKINDRTLIIAIQAVQAEIRRIENLPEADIVPGDEEFLVDLENAAEDLEEAYAKAFERANNLPPYGQLVHRREG